MTLEKLYRLLTGKKRLLSMPVKICSQRYGEQYKKDSEMILSFIENIIDYFGDDFGNVINDYLVTVEEQIRLQRKYQQTGTSIPSKENQMKELLVDDDFNKKYLYTLGLSYVLAPHRYDIFRYTRSAIKQYVKPHDRYLEIGTGIGFDTLIADSQRAIIDTYDVNRYSSLCLDALGVSENVRNLLNHIHY